MKHLDDRVIHAHRYELAVAEHCAVERALQHGAVHVGHVADALVRLGVILPRRPGGAPQNRWFGIIFRRHRALWCPTGERAVISNRARGSNSHSVVVWRLVDGADTAPFLALPERPAWWVPPSDAPAVSDESKGSASSSVAAESAVDEPLPFDPLRAATEVEYLEKKGLMRGEAASPVLAALVTWLRAPTTRG